MQVGERGERGGDGGKGGGGEGGAGGAVLSAPYEPDHVRLWRNVDEPPMPVRAYTPAQRLQGEDFVKLCQLDELQALLS